MNLEVLIRREWIDIKVKGIAAKINEEFKNKDLIIICVLKGSFLFVSDLIRNIKNINCYIDFIQISSYGSNTESSGIIKLEKDIGIDIKNQNVLIIDDILDTGSSLSFLVDLFGNRDPKTLKTCVLLDKPERRKFNIKADYVGFEIENKFVVGYGLDYNEKLRELPDIWAVKENIWKRME